MPLRIYSVSDLHVHHRDNRAMVQAFTRRADEYAQGVLLVAGDVATRLDAVIQTLSFLKAIFRTVLFCPGNNELRLSAGEPEFSDSVRKYEALAARCNALGTPIESRLIDGVLLVPLVSWYTPEFEPSYDGDDAYQAQWLDFRACRWPPGVDPHAHFEAMTEAKLRALRHRIDVMPERPVVLTYSHFLPRRELLPKPAALIKRSLPMIVGSTKLDAQLRGLGSQVHVCGHTHIDHDVTIDGVRYVQHAMGHPGERKQWWKKSDGDYLPKLIYEH